MKTIISFTIILLLFTACKSTDSQTLAKSAQADQTRELIDTRNFETNMTWANPLSTNELSQLQNSGLLGLGNSAGRINLIGNANYMRFKGDSLQVYLPYFGTRQFGGNLMSNSGAIEFIGVPKEFKLEYDENKARTNIRFEINEGTENYNVYVTVFGNKKATVSVNSSQRNSIRYEGEVSKLKKAE